MKTYRLDRFVFMNLLRMESLLKRVFFLVLVLLPLALPAFAQSSADASLQISITVEQALSITETGTLDFGVAYPGFPVPAVDPKTASSIPLFTIAGEPNTAVTIALPASVNLSLSSSMVPFTPSVNGNQANDQGSSGTLSLGTISETLSPASGNYFLWLGGHINNDNPLPDLASGKYTGTYTIQVNY